MTKTISAKKISMKPTFRLDEDHFGEENYQEAHFWTTKSVSMKIFWTKTIFRFDGCHFDEDNFDEDHFCRREFLMKTISSKGISDEAHFGEG